MNDKALTELLLASNPQVVVLVGEPVFRLSELLHNELADDQDVRIVECADVSEWVELKSASTSTTTCIHLTSNSLDIDASLGIACRKSPDLVLVEKTESSTDSVQIGDERFFAFGFRSLGQASIQPRTQTRWYAYRLSDYKQAPDWLNARFWAHPERFDLPD